MVTLFGTILFDTADGRLCIDVRPDLGDAPRFKFAGELWLKKMLCHEVTVNAAGQLDVVRINYPLAVALSQIEAASRTRSR